MKLPIERLLLARTPSSSQATLNFQRHLVLIDGSISKRALIPSLSSSRLEDTVLQITWRLLIEECRPVFSGISERASKAAPGWNLLATRI